MQYEALLLLAYTPAFYTSCLNTKLLKKVVIFVHDLSPHGLRNQIVTIVRKVDIISIVLHFSHIFQKNLPHVIDK